MSAPICCGLDLSITATGCADAAGRAFTLSAGRNIEGDDRLTALRDAITFQLDIYTTPDGCSVDLVAVEGPVLRSQSAIALALLHGAVRAELMDYGCPYALVPPASLKKYATGKGNATKPDMAVALYKRTGLELGDDNQVDAWWLRAMALDHFGAAPVALPESHRAALAKIDWPSARGTGQ